MLTNILDNLQYPFIQNALFAGSCIAVVAAVVGYFLVIRGLTFAAHALPNIGFAGAAGAVLLGINPAFGLFTFTMTAGLGVALMGKEVRERDISIGVLMTFALGLGFAFASLHMGNVTRVYSILFGNILGIGQDSVTLIALVGVLVIGAIILLYRPLLFSSFDPVVAEARGVPVQALSILFLLLVAIAVSVSVEIVGALLVFTLLIGPAATALRIARRPLSALLLAIVLSLLYTWIGILLAADNGVWPPSFYIATVSFAVYMPVRLLSPLWLGRGTRQVHTSHKGCDGHGRNTGSLAEEHSVLERV